MTQRIPKKYHKSFRLSAEAAHALARIAKERGVSERVVLEFAIREYAARGRP